MKEKIGIVLGGDKFWFLDMKERNGPAKSSSMTSAETIKFGILFCNQCNLYFGYM